MALHLDTYPSPKSVEYKTIEKKMFYLECILL
jgi:hypothetical protein